MSHRSRIASIFLIFVFGFVTGAWAQNQGLGWPLAAKHDKPAYLIASWDILHPGQTKPFSDAVIPLARKAGLDVLALTSPELLEGEWPYPGIVILQKYDSMRALLDFWRSPEHSVKKKLRDGHINSHFVIAVEGRE